MTDDGWTNERREITHGEARAVIDAQNATMSDIDDKAMRTVRLTAVLIGLLLTAVQFAPALFDPTALTVTIGLLVLSTIVGIITCNESNLYVGPRGDYIETLTEATFERRTWDEHLLVTYSGMISENYDDIRWNSTLLAVTLATLIGGIIGAILSTAF